MNDETARQELKDAKREAIKALGVVLKVKEKVEAIELILTVEVLLFVNTDFNPKHFRFTRNQCLYFLRKLKEIPQVSQYLDMELKGAFSKGTFHSERMWLLSEVFRIDVELHSFFVSYFKQQKSLKDGASDAATDRPKITADDVTHCPEMKSDDATDRQKMAADDAADHPMMESDDAADLMKIKSYDAADLPKIKSDNAADCRKMAADDATDRPKVAADDAADLPRMAADDAADRPMMKSKNASDRWKMNSHDAADHPKMKSDNAAECWKTAAYDATDRPKMAADLSKIKSDDAADPQIRSEDLHASFQTSMEALYRKSKESSDLKELFIRQLNHSVDLYCLWREAYHWITAKHLATILSLDVRTIAEARITRLILKDLSEFEGRNDKRLLEGISSIYETSGLPLTTEVRTSFLRSQEEIARAFLNGGSRENLRNAGIIGDLFGMALPPTSEVVPQLLSYWSNLFLRYDENADSSVLWCVPYLVAIYGSIEILESREEVARSDDSLEKNVDSDSHRPGYEPSNLFSSAQNSKWMSAELKEGPPYHAWITRRLATPAKVIAVALKPTPHIQAAPTGVSLDGRNAEDEEWKILMEMKSVKWRRNEWKTFSVENLGSFREFRLNLTKNSSSNVISVSKARFYV